MKKFFRAIRILFLSAVLVSLCIGLYFYVTSDEMEYQFVSPFKESEYTEYNPTQDNIKTIGRTYYEDGVRYFSHSGSGVEFICKGEYALIRLIDDSAGRYYRNHKAHFAIYVNGEAVVDETLTESEKIFHIPLDGFEKESVVKIIKLSEAQYSSMGVAEIAVYSKNNIVPAALRLNNLSV